VNILSVPLVAVLEAHPVSRSLPRPESKVVPQSNPLQSNKDSPPCPTETLNSRTVFHESQAMLRQLVEGIRNQEELDGLREQMTELRYA
jgi:hypothetical protein